MLEVTPVWLAITELYCLVMIVGVILSSLALLLVLWKLKRLIATITAQLQPLAEKAGRVLDEVGRSAEATGERIQHIAQTADQTTSTVATRVQGLTELVGELVARPLVSGAALKAGLAEGWQVWVKRSQSDDQSSG